MFKNLELVIVKKKTIKQTITTITTIDLIFVQLPIALVHLA